MEIFHTEEGPAYGAAILSMVGANEYPSTSEAISSLIAIKEVIKPTKGLTKNTKKSTLISANYTLH